jgi:membrane-associated protein
VLSSLLERILSVPAPVVLLIVGSLVFAEDALFVGFVVPGETVAILGGVAANLGHVPLWTVLAVVITMAIVGDSVGFEVGRRYGTRVLGWKPLRRHAARIDDARDLLARRGGWAVLFGRWVAFFRAVMPALAGTTEMRYRTFLSFNALGGILWGTAVVLGGYLAGASYKAVEKWLGTGGAIVVGLVAVAVLVVWRVRRGRAERVREIGSVAAARRSHGESADPTSDPASAAAHVEAPSTTPAD